MTQQCCAVEPHVNPREFVWVKFEEEEKRKVFPRSWKRCTREATHRHVQRFGRSSELDFHRCEQHRSAIHPERVIG